MGVRALSLWPFYMRDYMIEHWKTALESHWGIEAALHPLAGEYDLNFLAQNLLLVECGENL